MLDPDPVDLRRDAISSPASMARSAYDFKQSSKLGEGAEVLLDAARAMAALDVMVAHSLHILAGKNASGAIAVAVFFILSGFLITLSVVRGWGSPSQFSRYLAVRTARIFVPLVPVLAAVIALNWFAIGGHWGSPGVSTGPLAAIGNLFLLNDYPLFQAASKFGDISSFYIRSYNSAEPLWTVAIEFWIYIFVGFVAIVLVKGEKIKMRLALPLFIVSLPVIIWNSFAGGGKFLTLIWLLGACGALLFIKLKSIDPWWKRPLAWSLIGYGGICLPPRIVESQFSSHDLQSAILGAFILFGLLLLCDTARVSPIISKFIRAISSYSYSLYLTHNTVIILVAIYSPLSAMQNVLLACVLANITAIIFYILFEQHYRRVADEIAPRLARLIEQRGRTASPALVAASSAAPMAILDEIKQPDPVGVGREEKRNDRQPHAPML